MTDDERRIISAWQSVARQVLRTSWLSLYGDDFRSAASRAYYAAYQAATAACFLHGDETLFPHGWNNPSHDQLPGLVRNNGDLEVETRRKIARQLRELRTFREDADYRPGRAIVRAQALHCAQEAESVLKALGVTENEPNR
jgi:uncharacterized protein (UPF0332 family)